MTALSALRAYEELLRNFRKNLGEQSSGLEGALESGLSYLATRLRLRNVGLFWWNPFRSCLEMEHVLHAGTLMEGEEEIPIASESPLWRLVNERCPVIVSSSNPWVAYIPLSSDNDFIGAIRVERQRPLPSGKVLRGLPRIVPETRSGERPFPLLEDIADILSARFQELFREENYRKKFQYFRAGAEVATAVVETPRLRNMLESVSESIIKNLGLDRIRFYLMDPARDELKGMVGLQIPDRHLSLETEKYPLAPDTNSLVDVVLAKSTVQPAVTAGGKVVFVPLTANGQIIGCMAIDNLLSQQVIDEEQISAVRTLAGQIGMAVMNARLFEDIEQQAITDGLTKLYVYRYFQQRLKEEIDRADRYAYGVALIMMDVDQFKVLNDSYGHPMGDKVLEFLAQTIRANIRRIDLAARYGGDEFILLLPEITEQEAWLMGSRLLNTLKQSSLRTPEGEEIRIGVTMGVAMYPSDARNGRDLIEAADRALYWGKKNTRGDIGFYRTVVGKVKQVS